MRELYFPQIFIKKCRFIFTFVYNLINNFMKKFTLLIIILLSNLIANAQNLLFEDNFESYTNFAIAGVGGWTLTDGDQLETGSFIDTTFPNSASKRSFMVFNSAVTTPPISSANWSARSGLKHMVCFYNIGETDPDIPAINNDWMISPRITLGTANVLSFFSKACDNDYVEEQYSVWISTTNTSISSFTKISAGDAITAQSINWFLNTLNLPTIYNNLPVYIGIKCSSENRFAFAVDDFKVIGNVSCNPPLAGESFVNIAFLTAFLSWNANLGTGGSQLVYQLAGTGVPSNASGTGTITDGIPFIIPNLTPNTSYEFYVRNMCSGGTSFSAWSGPYLFDTIGPPDCVTITAPANNALNIPLTLTSLGVNSEFKTANANVNWIAATSGLPAIDYNIYLGTAATTTTLLGTLTAPAISASLPLLYNTTYFCEVVPKNAGGEALNCSTFSFKTAVATSCLTNVEPKFPVMPFSVTVFTGAPSVISTNCFAGEYSEVNVTSGTAYNFSSSLATDYITISADGGLTSVAFGISNVTWVSTLTGIIRFYTHADNKCTTAKISRSRIVRAGPSLATDTFVSENFKSFPNPVKNILNLSYDKNITTVSIVNLLGQEVLAVQPNSTNASVDMSSLTSGAYMVKLNADNEVKTVKVIKE